MILEKKITKPNIWWNGPLGVWMCSFYKKNDHKSAYNIGLGKSPMEAYRNWMFR